MFNRKTAGFNAGGSGKLLHLTDRPLLVEAEERIRSIPLNYVGRISVCRTKPLTASLGERLQLKANAIVVTEPARNRRDVHAALNAPRRKQVPQIVVSEAGIFRLRQARLTAP